ncbi:hypothetical protein COT97_04175 [Candidatus Falkowbacteria bacterium CG10_big_fil_rev_8_21_14_0_10_39_11]|uniref:DNA polymerase III subunit gamma/tau n=1 Tax=Candidatus Falkowbacteria bacterium CG10_big_fil_rev_8_21_14_0_10_39_11 TaxID=1974565 RepID=A0A2H0V476_9BACT|nr:MAG: hypothetical protein COT97_04175 [Candidatus Falkowbacteria bacterium CG10_big_fil_rev_8_21_14_0_10_39_11]
MSVALYRKYRPQKFSDVSGQNHIKVTIQNELEADKLAHAYLFCGPRGTGKTTMARLLAKAVNCTDLKENGEPCNECDSCTELMSGRAMDIIEIDAASHTGVDNVRENIINNARFTPSKSKFKVFIIDEVHMLSISAFNALLKVLEEPPSHVLFILATTEVHKIPVTIISRCQRFDFQKVIFNELVKRLQWIVGEEGIKVDKVVLELIAKNAGGCVRDAESLLEQVLSLGEKHITLDQVSLILPRSSYETLVEFATFLFRKDTKSGIMLLNRLIDEGVDVNNFYNNLLEFLRKVMLVKITGDSTELLQDVDDNMFKKINDMVSEIPAAEINRIITIFLKIKDLFKHTNILQLPLEVAIVEISEGAMTIPAIPTQSDQNTAPVAPPAPPVEPPVQAIAPEPVASTPAQTPEVEAEEPSEEKIEEVETDYSNDDNPEPPAADSPQPPADNSTQEPADTEPVTPNIKNNNGMSVTFNQVLSRWGYIVQCIIKKNYTLGMSLSVGKPYALEGNTLTLGFIFSLQKDQVDKPDNLNAIKQVLMEEMGAQVNIATIVDSEIKLREIAPGAERPPFNQNLQAEVKIEQQETKDPIGQVLDAFGGAVVDKV